jgi:hypothetical protein
MPDYNNHDRIRMAELKGREAELEKMQSEISLDKEANDWEAAMEETHLEMADIEAKYSNKSMHERNKKLLFRTKMFLGGDIHELWDTNMTVVRIKLDNNNTNFKAQTLINFENELQQDFDDKVRYVRIYSDCGNWILEVYIDN